MEDKLREEIYDTVMEHSRHSNDGYGCDIRELDDEDTLTDAILIIINRREKEAFEQSRLTHPMTGFKYDTFEDYKSANENP